MYETNTKSWTRKLLNRYVLDDDGSLTVLSLVSLGVVAVVAHQYFRFGLSLPGHHGLEWMALLLFGRMQSPQHWAGAKVALGAAATHVWFVALGPSTLAVTPVFAYLLNGLCVDLLFRYTPGGLPGFVKGILLGGIGFITKPIFLAGTALLFGLQYGSAAKYGYYIPIATHFVFGAIGGICGVGLAAATRKRLLSTRSHEDP